MNPGIAHVNQLLLMGSCFTENIGGLLRAHKFSVLENPNGILFNPISVVDALDMYLNNEKINATDLFELNECWHSWRHHGRFSGLTIEEAMQKINASTQAAHDYLKHADYLFITLGSAWTYQLREEAKGYKPGRVAANNHKAPANWFHKKLLGVDEVLAALDNIIYRLHQFNNELKIIFTISPVRHLREGMIENNRSKAVLIQAVHHVVNKLDGLYYFPAYELVIDDLRDYRFYAEDLVHPNYHATKYVWEKFMEACITDETKNDLLFLQEIALAYKHNPFNPQTAQHIAFRKKYATLATAFAQTHTAINLEEEIRYFETGERTISPMLSKAE
jgi:hypothetical protein